MTGSATVDRKILRAFYTQYVSVLLVVLVVSIRDAQRDLAHPSSASVQAARTQLPVPVGTMELREIFVSDTSAELDNGRELEAVLETLKNHDLRAIFTLNAPLSSSSLDGFRLAIARARAIRSRVVGLRIPSEALRVVVGSTANSVSQASVSFESMEVADEDS